MLNLILASMPLEYALLKSYCKKVRNFTANIRNNTIFSNSPDMRINMKLPRNVAAFPVIFNIVERLPFKKIEELIKNNADKIIDSILMVYDKNVKFDN